MDVKKSTTSQCDLDKMRTMRQDKAGGVPSNVKTEHKTPSREGGRVRGEVSK